MPEAPGADRPTLVTTLAEMPELIDVLLADHRDNGHGRCTGCRTAGYGTPGEHWPCAPARLARAARQLLRRAATLPGSASLQQHAAEPAHSVGI